MIARIGGIPAGPACFILYFLPRMAACIDEGNPTFSGQPPALAGIQFNAFYDTSSTKFVNPVWFGSYPGIPGAFLVGELDGDLFLLDTGSGGGFQSTLFGHIPVTEATNNDGLLGITFHPDFKNNPRYYVYYNPGNGVRRLEERYVNASFNTQTGDRRSRW